ncbi:hypothetical protein [Nonomuraea sp. bgisy101]|uniref:hypothetical protein n=1 Tax=Nonomuraea sp. bgisy101 TaxID=3413784 RepID=UPI003D70A0E8
MTALAAGVSMQFIETSIIGVRSAVLTFRRPGSPMRFLLIPMVHVAEQAFYDQVAERLRGCDLIVAEGEPYADLLLHRRISRIRVDGLVHQLVGLDVESLGVPLLWPDRDDDRGRWFSLVMDALTAVPDWLTTIRFPSGGIDVTDLTGHDGWAGGRAKQVWRKLMLHERDKRLLDLLTRIHEERGEEPITVGVPWGAAHMMAVAGCLFSEFGYRVVAAEWVTVRNAR